MGLPGESFKDGQTKTIYGDMSYLICFNGTHCNLMLSFVTCICDDIIDLVEQRFLVFVFF